MEGQEETILTISYHIPHVLTIEMSHWPWHFFHSHFTTDQFLMPCTISGCTSDCNAILDDTTLNSKEKHTTQNRNESKLLNLESSNRKLAKWKNKYLAKIGPPTVVWFPIQLKNIFKSWKLNQLEPKRQSCVWYVWMLRRFFFFFLLIFEY